MMIAGIVLHACVKRVSVFDVFLKGANEGVLASFRLLPTLIGLITAVNMVQASGGLAWLSSLLAPITQPLGLPGEVIPLLVIHPISGSGATAVLSDLLSRYGADSNIGRVAAVLCGSNETTLYAVTVYYGSIGVEANGHTLPTALLADAVVALLCGVGVKLFF